MLYWSYKKLFHMIDFYKSAKAGSTNEVLCTQARDGGRADRLADGLDTFAWRSAAGSGVPAAGRSGWKMPHTLPHCCTILESSLPHSSSILPPAIAAHADV